MKGKNYTGLKFGRLEIISKSDHGRGYWNAKCECGNTKPVQVAKAVRGETKSCGCFRREIINTRRVAAIAAKTTHGHTSGGVRTTEYRIWRGMLTRCYNSNYREYNSYGGRGISVCERWRLDFTAFLSDMGPRPSKGHSLDRIDNNGDYCPDNCRWATSVEQSNNTRKCLKITINGVTLSSPEWCRKNGLRPKIANTRISQLGWDPVRAVTEPSRRSR